MTQRDAATNLQVLNQKDMDLKEALLAPSKKRKYHVNNGKIHVNEIDPMGQSFLVFR
jgi:hypothetical protein